MVHLHTCYLPINGRTITAFFQFCTSSWQCSLINFVFCSFPAVDNEDHTEEAPALGVDSKTELLVKKRSASNESVGKRDEKPEDKKENSLSFSNTNCDAGSKKEELSKGEKPVVKGRLIQRSLDTMR